MDILEVLDEAFDGILGKIPCYNTIENWVKKCGFHVNDTAGSALQTSDFAQIVDESMMIGSEKLLLTVAVPAAHQGRPLNFSDVSVLDMAVAASWNGEGVSVQLQKAAEKVGHNPQYVISDNASIMNKGVRCAELKHQHDISHSLGMHLARTYEKDADFTAYTKLMGDTTKQHIMKKVAYLLPPKQRTISRFINLSGWVKWSSKMLAVYHTLSADEQEVFSFIPANAGFIAELSAVVECVNGIEHLCKHSGFSKKTARQCQRLIKKNLLCGNARMKHLGSEISKFLKVEAAILATDTAVHNNSSDIIESLFAVFKLRKSPNKLYGVTAYILFLPIYAKLSDKKATQSFDFKTALEDVTTCKIKTWAAENLTENLVNMRTECLNKAG